MKEIKLSVPDNKAQVFAKEFAELFKKHEVEVDLSSLLPITERVKTYEDACRVLGFEPVDFSKMRYSLAIDGSRVFMTKDEIAYIKLKTIAAALNEGWVPTFAEDGYRYYPYFRFYIQESVNEMTEAKKKQLGLVGAGVKHGSRSGVAIVYAIVASSLTNTGIGSRLALKTSELAEYMGKQFVEIFADYIGKFENWTK